MTPARRRTSARSKHTGEAGLSADPGGAALPGAGEPPILSVSELTGAIKGLLEGSFPEVWVAGEVSNCSRPQSGHCYLTLKDDFAQLRAVMWRPNVARLRFELHDGLQVVCRGSLDVYAPRGTYQMVIAEMTPRGLGALELALRQLHARLAAEGLFDPQRKRLLPNFPRRIAVVTSPTGAAIRDFLEVLRRRWQATDVLVVPCRVQGEAAAGEIAAAIATANRLADRPDVLVVTRGGGSQEDLWAFNEEPVVRAIAASEIPVVSAVGHEIDVTLSDLAADRRALTPSEAAELVTPDARTVARYLRDGQRRLRTALADRSVTLRRHLDALAQRRVLRRPQELIFERARRLDERAARLHRAARLQHQAARDRYQRLAAHLESLSPLGVLARGYSVTQTGDGELVFGAEQLRVGQVLETTLARGRAWSRVERWEQTAPPPGLPAADLTR